MRKLRSGWGLLLMLPQLRIMMFVSEQRWKRELRMMTFTPARELKALGVVA